MEFIDVKVDTAFKRVFGDDKHKDILIDFLNSVIPFEAGAQIETLEILNPNNSPHTMRSKDSYVDVKVQLSDKKKILIEMQMCQTRDFSRRVMYNTAHTFASQLRRGEKYHKVADVISLNIVNFILRKNRDRVVTTYTMMSKEDFDEYFDKDIIQVIFVELPKFKKQEVELFNKMDKWLYFLKNVDQFDAVPKILEKEEPIKEAFLLLDKSNLTEEESNAYMQREDFLINNFSFQEEVKEEGRKEGREEGREEGEQLGIEKGKKEASLATAKELLSLGVDHAIIIKSTGLSREDIERLSPRK